MAIEDFELCIKPKFNLELWRYMDLEKFESLLKNSSLFFCRADRFADPFEGSIPKREVKEDISGLSNQHRLMKKQKIINCWHINNSENDSMWKLYLKSNEGIAIRTTVERLKLSFANTKELVFCSQVRYLDYEKDIWYHETDYPHTRYNMFIPLVHKRIEFIQENELRLIHSIDYREFSNDYWEKQPIEKGKNIRIDINVLVDEIYCAPTCDNYQTSKTERIIQRYGYKFNVKKYKLSSQPYY